MCTYDERAIPLWFVSPYSGMFAQTCTVWINKTMEAVHETQLSLTIVIISPLEDLSSNTNAETEASCFISMFSTPNETYQLENQSCICSSWKHFPISIDCLCYCDWGKRWHSSLVLCRIFKYPNIRSIISIIKYLNIIYQIWIFKGKIQKVKGDFFIKC